MNQLAVHYSYGLIAVSVLTSMIAAYAAFSLADRMRWAANAVRRQWWLVGGSVAMGIGIWSMHYLGMLAVQLPVDVAYFVPTVLLSLGLAVGASAVVLSVVSAERAGRQQILGGGLLMGAGIGGMHYVGMEAMRSSAMHHYAPAAVVLSLLMAVGFSAMALWVGFSVREESTHGEWMRVAGGVVMGLGIAAMHYTAMAGLRYMPDGMRYSDLWTVKVDALGRTAVIVTSIMVLIAAVGSALLDKYRFRELKAVQQELLEMQKQLLEANSLLNELSIRDGLTGLFNRRHFDAVFATELRRAVRVGLPLSVLMIDVDHFKEFNDTFGHLEGDECLREIARVLEEKPKRGHDCVARYGGEEFAVVLPGSDIRAAVAIAESIRASVMELSMEQMDGNTMPTVSIGVCSRLPERYDAAEDMLRDADTALYVAKNAGRNRVMAAEGMVSRK